MSVKKVLILNSETARNTHNKNNIRNDPMNSIFRNESLHFIFYKTIFRPDTAATVQWRNCIANALCFKPLAIRRQSTFGFEENAF